MKQQINLYQPIFRKQKKVFSAATMLQIVLFFVVVLAAVTAYEIVQLQPLQQQARQLDTNNERLETQLAQLQRRADTDAKTKLLKREIARLSMELEERTRIQRALEDNEVGNSTGFSGHLEAFARQHVKGTWLTRVSISNGGAGLGLEGKSLSSELVPIYIQKLSNEAALTGASFNVMELRRPEKEIEQIAFRVSTN